MLLPDALATAESADRLELESEIEFAAAESSPKRGNFKMAARNTSPTWVKCIALPTCFRILLADRAAGADDARQLENIHGVPALATCSSVIGKPDIDRTSTAVTNVVE